MINNFKKNKPRYLYKLNLKKNICYLIQLIDKQH